MLRNGLIVKSPYNVSLGHGFWLEDDDVERDIVLARVLRRWLVWCCCPTKNDPIVEEARYWYEDEAADRREKRIDRADLNIMPRFDMPAARCWKMSDV